MTVSDLREALASMPDHWPVTVEVFTDGLGYINGNGGNTDYHYTLDCVPSNFPTQGCMATARSTA